MIREAETAQAVAGAETSATEDVHDGATGAADGCVHDGATDGVNDPAAPPCSAAAHRGTRRRGEALESAIYAAALDQLSRVGYAGLTMEGIAAAAHTGKASLYRRWAHKDDLVVDALDAAMPHVGEPPDTGSVRGDLVALLVAMADFICSPAGWALQHSLMSAYREAGSPEAEMAVCEALHGIKQRVVSRRQQLIYSVLRRGVERGEVRPDAVRQRIVETGPALLLTYCIGQGRQVPHSEVDSIVDEVLMPLIRPTTD